MTIYEGSRYETATVVPVKEAGGNVRPAVYANPDDVRQHFDYSRYVVRDGDRLDMLASRVYGDAELWWIIARANPEIFYPEDLPFGIILRIPYASDVL